MVFTVLLGFFLLLLVYPFAVYPLILRFFPKRPTLRSPDNMETAYRVALIFSAYNEERSLPSKLENIRELKARMPNLKVHVYSDGSTDRTVEILRSVPELLTAHVGAERVGKATGMRQMVDACDAEIVICTDANVILDPPSLPRILSYFGDPSVGTVTGTLHYTNGRTSQTAWVSSLYWRVEERIKKLESDTGSTMGADGSVFAIRRDLYPRVPPNLLDDLVSSISPLFGGYRVVSAPDVHAFERSATEVGDEFQRRRRIACRGFNTHRYLAPHLKEMSLLDRFKYTSHRYLRWLSAFWLLMIGVCGLAGIASAFGMQAAGYVVFGAAVAWGIGYAWQVPVLGWVAKATAIVVAVGVGVLESMLGKEYQTWAPPRSR